MDYDGVFYEQVDGIAIGFPLSSTVADFVIEAFELAALAAATLNPKFYKHFVDDTLLIWSHGHETLTRFVDFLKTATINKFNS